MAALAQLLGAQRVRSTAVIGSGGKTTLLWYLAAALGQNPANRVLVATTTKIGVPSEDGCYDRTAFLPEGASAAVQAFFLEKELCAALPGVTLAGVAGSGRKIGALPPDMLQLAAKVYTHVLFEADGAHMRPLKGWAGYEPVVPDWTARTIGVAPVWPVGHAAGEGIIHRFPQFCAITGIREGQAVTAEHIAAAIAAPQGLFAKARGKKVLFFSAWQPGDEARAKDVLRKLPDAFLGGLSMVVAGDANNGTGEVLLNNI